MLVLKMIAALAVTSCVLLGQAKSEEVLKVGITTTGVPLTFVDTLSSKSTGAMVDLAASIAAECGMRVEYEVSAFPALIPALTTGKINLISAAMFVTQKRKEVVDFSLPVYEFGETMFVAANDSNDYTREALKGETVGAPIGSTIAEDLQQTGLFTEVRQYDSIADIVRDVRLGRIKAGFADRPIVAYQLSRKPDLGVRLVEGYKPLHVGQVALAVSKHNAALLERINAAIEKLQRRGDIAKIFAQYGL
ncbi:ABC transporter substrate-binding protein [Labrys sp. La1]|uniref:ABC transporter substrate-binding protein n=1 Tax=Labrys sp. La1 TaxID=3404917 RepID=UPI003EB9D510